MTSGVEFRHEADGTPYVRPYLGTDAATGKPIRPYKSFKGMTDEEAADAAAEWLETVVPARELGAAPTVEGMLSARLRSLYMSMDAEGVGPSRVLTAHAFLSGTYRAWQERGLVAANPMDAVPKPHIGQSEARALDEDEYRALNARLRSILSRKREAGSDPVEAQTAMSAFFAEHTAARVGEVCGVLRKDVRPQWGDVLIARTASETRGGVLLKECKGKKAGAIALDEDLREQLFDWMRFQKSRSPARPRGRPCCRSTARSYAPRPSRSASRRCAAMRASRKTSTSIRCGTRTSHTR